MYTVCMSSTFHDATLATVTVFLYRIYNKITNKQTRIASEVPKPYICTIKPYLEKRVIKV